MADIAKMVIELTIAFALIAFVFVSFWNSTYNSAPAGIATGVWQGLLLIVMVMVIVGLGLFAYSKATGKKLF